MTVTLAASAITFVLSAALYLTGLILLYWSLLIYGKVMNAVLNWVGVHGALMSVLMTEVRKKKGHAWWYRVAMWDRKGDD